MSLVIPEYSEMLAISDTATVVFAGPCILKGFSGEVDGEGANLKFYDGVSGTASNSLKFEFRSDFPTTLSFQDMHNTIFRRGLAYDATGSTTGVYVFIHYVPLKGWHSP